MHWARLLKGAGLLTALAVTAGCAAYAAATEPPQPFPLLPERVRELYLPEEREVCTAAYALYLGLPGAERGRLHSGAPTPLDPSVLTKGQAAALADWYNSARWGCDPPPERLVAESVRDSEAVLTCGEGVIEIALCSPQQRMRKELAVACGPERVEWVRAGLPLLPAWSRTPWDGGAAPPEPLRGSNTLDRDWHEWRILRRAYSVYASLPEDRLRDLHAQHEIRLPFGYLPPAQRQAIGAAWDEKVEYMATGFGRPAGWGRPAELRQMDFGISEVRLTHARNHDGCVTPLQPFPEPHRAVYVEFDPLVPPAPSGGVQELPPLPEYGKREPVVWLVAVPPQVQQRALAWEQECRDWIAKWHRRDGAVQYTRPGAPPWPSPWPDAR